MVSKQCLKTHNPVGILHLESALLFSGLAFLVLAREPCEL